MEPTNKMASYNSFWCHKLMLICFTFCQRNLGVSPVTAICFCMQVYHSAWRELCEGMAAAKSLDEVIEAHEAYILSIQRQCFVVPDKLVIHHVS